MEPLVESQQPPKTLVCEKQRRLSGGGAGGRGGRHITPENHRHETCMCVKLGGGGQPLHPLSADVSLTHGQCCTVQDMMHEVRAEPPDHRTGSAGPEVGEACQRTLASPLLRALYGGGGVFGF